MLRGLIDDRAMERCRAVAFVSEAEAVKPGGPSSVEVPLEPNFVVPPLVQSHAPKVESDMMRPPHHM